MLPRRPVVSIRDCIENIFTNKKAPPEKVGRKATLFLAKSVSTNGDAGG